MSNHTLARLSLQAMVATASQRAEVLRAKHASTGNIPWPELEDHRTAVIGDICDALDQVEGGLGDLLLDAMFPLFREQPEPVKTIAGDRFDAEPAAKEGGACPFAEPVADAPNPAELAWRRAISLNPVAEGS